MKHLVSVLGETTVTRDGTSVTIASRKQRELLTTLAIRRGAPRSTEALVQDLWGDVAPLTARKNVQVLVGRIRAALGSTDAVCLLERGYALDASRWTFEDAMFEDELREARRLVDQGEWAAVVSVLDIALGRWTGNALGSLSGEHWASGHARVLEADRRAASILLNDARLRTGDVAHAVIDLTEATTRHPSDLDLCVLLVRALQLAGRQSDALARCRKGMEHARRIRIADEVERFRKLEHTLLMQLDEFAVRGEPTLPLVPVPRHELIGREVELAAVRDHVLTGHRLTTIVGPGGTGKTRLATAVADAIRNDIEDLAWIDLSPATTTDDVLATLLNAFGITSTGEDPAGSLVQSIGARRLMLILDNFEQVIESAGLATRLRDECPNLSVLITSRVPLDAVAEDVVSLTPFHLVENVEEVDPGVVDRLDAVRLFYDRASIVDGIVMGEASDVRDVHRICAKVDGLPLGIELAAARTRLLSPIEILEQLDETFSLIASSSTGRPERHRSLQNVISWSYELLEEEERVAFQALSLFVDGCEVEDFAIVSGLTDTVHAGAMLDRLALNSLATCEAVDGYPHRWRMLETIGAFGRVRLTEDPGGAELRSRFVQRMVSHAAASNTYTAHSTRTEHRFILERANVHAAFDWAIEHSPEDAADIYIGMDRYLHTRGSMFEGDELGHRLLPVVDQLNVRRRALVLGLVGRMAHYAGDEALSVELLGTAIDLAHEHGLDDAEVRVRIWRVERRRMSGSFREAMDEAEIARSLGERIGATWFVALALAQMGFACIDHESPQEGTRYFLMARDIFHELGDGFWSLNMDVNLASIDVVETGDVAVLERLYAMEAELARLAYWTYAAHTGSAVLRCELELARFGNAATYADSLVPRVRKTGETLMLMFTLACASVAYLEVERRELARQTAWESLVLAVQTKGLLFVDYSLATLACSSDDRELARWIASHIDMDYLDGMFALDRHLVSELADRVGAFEHSVVVEGEGRLVHITRVVDRLRGTSDFART